LVDRPATLGPVVGAAIADSDRLLVSAISAWEIGTLVRRGRIRLTLPVLDWLRAAVASDPRLEIAPVGADIAIAAAGLGDAFGGDPADRLIYATALAYNCPLGTKDERISAFDPARTCW
jgi:PIN domain nuclease of toxin-antitoxin system